MIENWYDEKYPLSDSCISSSYNQKEKWKGVNLDGISIYGSSLREIRHIIDYPGLYKLETL